MMPLFSLRQLIITILLLWVPPASAADADPFPALLKHPASRAAAREVNGGRPVQALPRIKAALSSGDLEAEEAQALRFLEVLALLRAGRPTDALQAIEDMDESDLPAGLRTHAAWYHGKLLTDLARPKKPDRQRAVELLMRIPLAGRFGLDARRLVINELLKSGETEEACNLASETAEHLFAKKAEAAARLQEANCFSRLYFAVGRRQGWKEAAPLRERAAGLYRLTATMWPTRPAGQAAVARLKGLRAKGVKPAPIDPQQLLRRAEAVLARPRGRKDLWRLKRIRSLAPAKKDDPVRCNIEIMYAEVAFRFRHFRTARRLLSSVKRHARDVDLRARAGVDLAGLVARYRVGQAIQSCFEIAEKWPKVPSAAWALHRAGQMAKRTDNPDLARKAFELCILKYPDSPASARSRFALAWMLYLKGKPHEALPLLDYLLASAASGTQAAPNEPLEVCQGEECQQEGSPGEMEPLAEGELEEGTGKECGEEADPAAGPGEDGEKDDDEARPEDWSPSRPSKAELESRRFAERVRYWRGRIHEALEDRQAAIADYRRLVDEHPLDYYSLMAIGRLAALGEETPEYAAKDEEKDHLASLHSLHPDVAAAATYMRMNLVPEVWATLTRLPRDVLQREDRRVASTLWLVLGQYSRSLWTSPVHWEGGLPGPPRGYLLVDARLAYPRAYFDIVNSPARDTGVPAALLFAIMRAESAFRPRARSPARARGLTQLVWRTAYRTARSLGIKRIRPWSLYDPEMSIRLGSAHMAELLRRFKGNPALMLAAYNAGEPAVYRWLAKRCHLPLDAFIEEIPYAETYRYVRKVLSFYAIYRALYEPDQGPLKLRLRIPSRLCERARKANTALRETRAKKAGGKKKEKKEN